MATWMTGIVVLVPVLDRPARVRPLIESLAASSPDVGVLFLCSPGDLDEIATIREQGEDYVIVGWEAGPGDYARKINLGFNVTDHPFVFTGADDLDFQPGWAEAALMLAERTACGVIGTNDDANPMVKRGKHSTHSLVRRTYIDRFGGTWHDGPGTVFHEGYDHQWVDTELVQAAIDRDQWAFSQRSLVRHLHPMFDKTVSMDATYRKALAAGSSDAELFQARRKSARGGRS